MCCVSLYRVLFFEKRHVATGGCRAQRLTEIASEKTQRCTVCDVTHIAALQFEFRLSKIFKWTFAFQISSLSSVRKQEAGRRGGNGKCGPKGWCFFFDLVKEKEVSDIKAGLPNVFGPKKKTKLLLESSRSLV